MDKKILTSEGEVILPQFLTALNTALCLTIRYNSRGGKKEKNETLLPRDTSKDR